MENETHISLFRPMGLSFWNKDFQSFASDISKDINSLSHKAW
jgi:hypothetical protein